jgi:ribosome-binding factor A
MTRRTQRVNDLLREEISQIVLRELADPRLQEGLISITSVEVSSDLRHARVYASVMGADEERDEVFAALETAKRFMERELTRRLKMRSAPSLAFHRDDSIERGVRLTQLIKQVAEDQGDTL